MDKQNVTPCADCQKAFHGHRELSYLYCGHSRVILFRERSGSVELVAVKATSEAIEIIQQRAGNGVPAARSA